ncbi:MAG: hypothetical protein QF506_04565 [Candidatus Woesearchaeota archaeon]|nr:hypothetical protein [Candidatus Woesearchaeota archaeon]
MDNEQTEEDCIFYYNKKDDWPHLFYFPHTIEVEEVSDWENSGFKVVSELNVNYHLRDPSCIEAERLTKEIARKFDVVVCLSASDEYIPGEEYLD